MLGSFAAGANGPEGGRPIMAMTTKATVVRVDAALVAMATKIAS